MRGSDKFLSAGVNPRQERR